MMVMMADATHPKRGFENYLKWGKKNLRDQQR